MRADESRDFFAPYSILMRRARETRLHLLHSDDVVTGARARLPLDRSRAAHRRPLRNLSYRGMTARLRPLFDRRLRATAQVVVYI